LVELKACSAAEENERERDRGFNALQIKFFYDLKKKNTEEKSNIHKLHTHTNTHNHISINCSAATKENQKKNKKNTRN